LLGKFKVTPACKCEADKAVEEHRLMQLAEYNARVHKFSDDDQMVPHATFEGFQVTPGTKAGLTLLQDFVANTDEWKARGVYLFGANGLGKSHLLSAAANQLRRNHKSVIYTTAKMLIAHLKSGGSRWEYLHAYKVADVLIIDEIGADIPADWEMGDLFNILNGRQHRKPTLFGSNLSVKELEAKVEARQAGWGTRLMERIIEGAYTVKMTGESYRFRRNEETRKWVEGRLKGT